MNAHNLPSKPAKSQACNGCGFCCATEPCDLAQEFLGCSNGPCVALEFNPWRTHCGLVCNPLGCLFKAAHSDQDVPVLDEAPPSEAGHQLCVQLSSALGLGVGCDAEDDDEDSRSWPR
jgi:hypothetical protein